MAVFYRVKSPNGKEMTLDESQYSAFMKKYEKVKDKLEGSGKKFEIRKVQERTTPQEREKYFGGGVGGALASAFPNIAEQYMYGNRGLQYEGKDAVQNNTDLINAGLSDVFSLPGRAVAGAVNSAMQDGEGFNLNRRAYDKGGSVVGNVVRDPALGETALGGKAMAYPVQLGAKTGAAIGGIVGPKVSQVGRTLGGAAVGAGEGALLEGSAAAMNGTEPNYALGAATGGAFEGLGTVAQQILQRFSKADIKAAAKAVLFGTERDITDAELMQVLRDERKASAIGKVLDASASGMNLTPFAKDRGLRLVEAREAAGDKAAGILKNEPSLNSGFDVGVPEDIPPQQRRQAVLDNKVKAQKEGRTEVYKDKVPYRPEQRTIGENLYQRDYPVSSWEEDVARREGKDLGKMKDPYYQSKAEYDLEQFGRKYDLVQERVSEMKTSGQPMTRQEKDFLERLEKNVAKDKGALNGYDANFALSSNKFFGDRLPFNMKELEGGVGAFDANVGVSKEFKDRVKAITSDAKQFGEGKINAIRDYYKENNLTDVLERALGYDRNGEHVVVNGYRDAMDEFADTIDAHIKNSVGGVRKDRFGKQYLVKEGSMGSYAYDYLDKWQQAIAQNGALNPKQIVALYGEAAEKNDKAVMDAVIKFLDRLGVDRNVVKQFEKEGGDYAMLAKARGAMGGSKSQVKGSRLTNVILPQDGFNARNAIGQRFQGFNFDTRTGKFNNKPTKKAGTIARNAVYDLNRAYPRKDERERDY